MMLTRCPSCETIFRITPEQLKARQGRVRCGECRHVFNALDTLLDESGPLTRPVPPEVPVSAVDCGGPPQASQATTPHTAADPLRGAGSSRPGGEFPASGPDAPPFPGEPRGEAPDPPAASEPSAPADGPPDPAASPAPEVLSEPPVSPAESPSPAASPEPVAEAGPEPAPESAPEPAPEAAPPADGAFDPDAESFLADTVSKRRRWPWVLATLLASMFLAGQAVHHFRVELAVLHPDVRRALATGCEMIACDLPLPKQASQLGIESSDLHPDPENKARLLLSATLRNRAPFPQALPHLEVTLTDTGDQALVRKVLAPATYLPGRRADEGIAANSDLPVSLVIDAASVPA
ncbi:MAG: zinc-ribbon domain-containing protein, partial [Rhodocyclaceae bacterium]|nr:zinc-ribbon domain-containing protein [Rhodocyclaceae bacterium]